MNTRYFITPTAGKLRAALAAWQWLGLGERKPILVTAFADVFLRSREGIWFLNTLEGKLEHVCETRRQLDALLATPEGRLHYLMADLVDRAHEEGCALDEGQSYDFKRHPVAGGVPDHANVERRNFVVALHIRGQLHDQFRTREPGTWMSQFVFEEKPQRPWWKIW